MILFSKDITKFIYRNEKGVKEAYCCNTHFGYFHFGTLEEIDFILNNETKM